MIYNGCVFFNGGFLMRGFNGCFMGGLWLFCGGFTFFEMVGFDARV